MPTFVSERQLEANRANARKSTGPRTEEGKQRAAANAVKHGFLARVVPETTPGWKDLLTGLYRSLRPADEAQQLLVDQIAVAYVRLARIYQAEQRAHTLPPYVASHIEELQHNAEKAQPSARQYLGTIVGLARDIGSLHLASAYYGSNAARTMARYESTLNRQIQRNLQLLWLLQARAADAAQPAEPPPFLPFAPAVDSAPSDPTDPPASAVEPAEPVLSLDHESTESPDSTEYDPGYLNESLGLDPTGSHYLPGRGPRRRRGRRR